jgi:hypothetical protein
LKRSGGLNVKGSTFVIFVVTSLGFLFIPLSIPESSVASSVTLYEPTEITSITLRLPYSYHPYQEPDPDGEGICYMDRREVHVSTEPNFVPSEDTWQRNAYDSESTFVYGLTPSTTYYLKIVVSHTSDNDPQEPSCSLGKETSNEVSATTLPSTINFRGAVANPDRPWDTIDLSWRANRDMEGFEKYVIERAFTANFSDAVMVANIENQATEHYSVGGLSPSTAYFFKIAVHATTGKASLSSPIAATTEDVREAIGVSLSAPFSSDITQTGVGLRWHHAYYRYCDKHVIERATSPDFNNSVSITMQDCNITEYIWGDLEAGTKYYFRVVSHNAAGIEATSNTVTATTKSQPVPMTEIMFAANTAILVIILLLVLMSLMRKRSKSSKQE